MPFFFIRFLSLKVGLEIGHRNFEAVARRFGGEAVDKRSDTEAKRLAPTRGLGCFGARRGGWRHYGNRC